ncbi:hypothetical protein [Nonomuraea ceibae]|uniref:hypothetical protein n=1 Tax=Nonomuraea ceibae TaxID=1935170 RepID=UPI001C5F847E|nr:hypothetical protein [Nonomuraea ceibae]
MFRVVRTRTLRDSASEIDRLHQAWQETERTLGVYRNQLETACEELRTLREALQEALQRADDTEARYHQVVNGIGMWVNETRAAMRHRTTGHQFRGDLAISLWESFVVRAEEAGDGNNTLVQLIKHLVVQDPEEEEVPS